MIVDKGRVNCRDYEDVYNDPGTPMSRQTSRGTSILAKIDGERKLLLQGRSKTNVVAFLLCS